MSNQNLKKLDVSFRDDRHISCVRFSKNESIKHKLAKSVSGILASEGIPVEDIADFFKQHFKDYDDFTATLMLFSKNRKVSDDQSFIQEARFINGRRGDHWQFELDKILEFETDKNIEKKEKNVITVRLNAT